MNKELIDRVWKYCLPKEFKEEVKYEYRRVATKATKDEYDLGFMHAHEGMFGIDNLTSDAEGEVELLHATRQKVMGLYANAKKIHNLYTSATCINTKESQHIDICEGVMSVLDTLFGSKCLPDEEQSKQKNCDNPLADKEGCKWRNDGKCAFDNACYFEPLNPQEPKSAEPKFHVGDRVRVAKAGNVFNHAIGEIIGISISGSYYVLFQRNQAWFRESDLEPYTEPKESPRQFYRIMGADEHGRQVITPIPPEVAGPYDISEERTEQKENVNLSKNIQKCDKQFDNILRDSFSKERRLNIAAMITAGIYSNDKAASQFNSIEALVRKTLDITDTLIAECEPTEKLKRE